MLRTVIFDTVTGDPMLQLDPASAQWAAKLDGSGTGNIDVDLVGSGLSRGAANDLFQVNSRMVAHIDKNDTVIAAGFVTQVPYARVRGVVSCDWVDIRDLFRERMGFGVGSWNPTGTLQVTNRSYSGAVRAIVYRMMRDGTQPTWELPIDLPADGSGTFSRKWDYFANPTMDDCLREIEDEGVEIYFDPYLTSAGKLRFETRVGTPITGSSFPLPVSAPESRIEDLVVTRDGTKQLTGVIYAGNGTDADTKTAWAGHGPYNIPIRDAYRSAKDVKSVAQLQRMADADLDAHFNPLEQWSFSVRMGAPVTAAHLKPGRLLQIDVQNDPWLSDGTRTQRVIEVSGDLTDKFKVEVQQHG